MSELFCQPCGDEGTRIAAFGVCLDCNEYLCKDCHRLHCRPRQMRHHRLLDGEQMLEHKPEMSTVDTCTLLCPDHFGENIKFLCEFHQVCCCSACIFEKHQNCGVVFIQKASQDTSFRKEMDKTDMNSLSDLDLRLNRIIDDAKTNIMSIEESDAQSQRAINEFRTTLNVVLNKLENVSVKKAERYRTEGVEKMKTRIAKADCYRQKLKDLIIKINDFKEQQQYSNMIVTSFELEKLDNEIENSLGEIQAGNFTKAVLFEPDNNLLACINTIGSFGKITETTESQIDLIKHSSDIDDETTQIEVSDIIGIVEKDVCILAETENIFTCNVELLTVLSKDRIVLADFDNLYTYKWLKLVNVKRNTIVSKLSLEFEHEYGNLIPYAIEKIQENTIAVSIWHKGIVIVQAKSRLIIERILTSDAPCSMSFCKSSGFIYFCDSTHKCLNRIDLQGRITNVLTCDKYSEYIPVSSAANRTSETYEYVYMILEEGVNSRYLAMVSLDGSIKEKIDLPNKPDVIQSDEAGTLLFVLAKDVIYVMKVGSTHAQVLLTKDDGLLDAQSFAYDDKHRKLYVGMKNNNFIKVYKLSGI